MANNFDAFPVYNKLTMPNGFMTSDWQDFIATFYQNLTEYLSQFGMFVPKVTTTERDSIQSPVIGQLIYNTSIDELQVYKLSSGWTTI